MGGAGSRPEETALHVVSARFALSTLAGFVSLWCGVVTASEPAEYSRHLRFSLTIENPSGEPAKDQHLWFYAPVVRTTYQRLEKLEVSVPHQRLDDALGNTIVHVTFDRLAPYQTQIVQVSAVVRLGQAPDPTPRDSLAQFLDSEPNIETGDPDIQRLARELRRNSDQSTSRAIFQWIRSNLTDTGFVAEDRGAKYALRERRGDCTEYAYLAVALARVNRIPARVVGGYYMDRDMELKSEDYHNWAEFHLDGSWRVVDGQKGNLFDKVEHYLAFRIVSNRVKNPLEARHRFVATEGLNVRIP